MSSRNGKISSARTHALMLRAARHRNEIITRLRQGARLTVSNQTVASENLVHHRLAGALVKEGLAEYPQEPDGTRNMRLIIPGHMLPH